MMGTVCWAGGRTQLTLSALLLSCPVAGGLLWGSASSAHGPVQPIAWFCVDCDLRVMLSFTKSSNHRTEQRNKGSETETECPAKPETVPSWLFTAKMRGALGWSAAALGCGLLVCA